MLSSDEEARFWSFYRETSEALYRKAYRMCRYWADAEDAHQTTYLKALAHWPTVSGLADKQRTAWMARTLTNEVLQILRARYRSREAGPDEPGWDPPAPTVTVDVDAVVAADAYHRACRAIARLEGRQREVIALHCLAGYEISEVAEMLGVKPPTVRTHLHVGRARLREIMAREEGSA